ncbi:MAG: regulatory protein RecX [Demequina sp.]
MTVHARQESATTTSADPAECARSIALGMLNHSPRSSGQVRSRLRDKDIPAAVIDEVIDRYIEVGLLDDAALAATIVRTRHQEKGRARTAIEMELCRKEFPADAIESALEQITADDEYVTAHALGASRWRSLEGHTDEVRSRRVAGMLGRKGYSPSVAFAVVKSLSGADNEGISSM